MLFILLIIVGVLAVFCGLSFKVIKISKNTKRKNITGVIESVEENIFVKTFLDVLTKNKGLWLNRFEARVLELSEVGISLRRLYLIKVLCFLLCIVVFSAIRCTNMGYEQRLVIENTEKENSLFYSTKSQDNRQYRFYRVVLTKVGKDVLESSDDTELYHLVEEKVAEVLNSSDKQEIDENTRWFIDKWEDTQKIGFFKSGYMWLILISLFLPDIFLVIRWLVKGALYKKEIIKLEYIFELLARIDGIKTLDIIYELEKSSKTYQDWLRQFAVIFRYDKRKGFDYLKNKNVKSLSKFTDIIEIYSLHDKEVALQILDREAIERDEAIIMVADETLDFIDLIAFISIVPLVYELARLMLNPMLDIVYKAFEFI
ncbi:hypothetical protein [Ruminiclostridium papyrosolvens]|uniref:Uncharacterized protein n=1 Tax=Ruminiclostridium papyrosolvens C7 TaxID=1330534 RepID=U4R7D7_9FIRM|nr:hypothetical protein [Ruminiclostridium papyrosolvens]EPR14345.1 hypothetical protein L323_00655 [Ruminiclostridium papyrosolvens C7]